MDEHWLMLFFVTFLERPAFETVKLSKEKAINENCRMVDGHLCWVLKVHEFWDMYPSTHDIQSAWYLLETFLPCNCCGLWTVWCSTLRKQEPAPVLPTVHYNMGGIPTNWKTQVALLSFQPSLFSVFQLVDRWKILKNDKRRRVIYSTSFVFFADRSFSTLAGDQGCWGDHRSWTSGCWWGKTWRFHHREVVRYQTTGFRQQTFGFVLLPRTYQEYIEIQRSHKGKKIGLMTPVIRVSTKHRSLKLLATNSSGSINKSLTTCQISFHKPKFCLKPSKSPPSSSVFLIIIGSSLSKKTAVSTRPRRFFSRRAAPPCMAPTAWAPTVCWTWWSSAVNLLTPRLSWWSPTAWMHRTGGLENLGMATKVWFKAMVGKNPEKLCFWNWCLVCDDYIMNRKVRKKSKGKGSEHSSRFKSYQVALEYGGWTPFPT